MDRAEAFAQIAIIAINVLGSSIAAVRGMLASAGATNEELDAAIGVVQADAKARKALADAASGRTE
jgi:uncharacterized protein YdbL (DUF1318 family)